MPKAVEKKPRKNKKAYDMPKPLPKGTILTAILKSVWEIGSSIGKGGFGEIYSASKATDSKNNNDYVVKIEPHVNGPLFVEMNFYLRNAKQDDITEFKQAKKLKHLGMPLCIAHGSHEHEGEKYRFLVMNRYGKDLWSVFLESGKVFPLKTVFQISIQILDVLEYIHNRGFVHADIKGSNILLSLTNDSHLYLVDFGLASRYTSKEYKPDPRFAHNGTIEYTSRDAHNGVPTRRGDIEILLYNMVHWAGGKLPWENLSDPKTVQNNKESSMENITKFLEKSFDQHNKVPEEMSKLFKLLLEMKYDTEPKYSMLRSIMLNALKKQNGKLDAPLNFKIVNGERKPLKRKSTSDSPVKSPAKSKRATKESKEDLEKKPKVAQVRKRVKKVVKEEISDSGSDASSPDEAPKSKAAAIKRNRKKIDDPQENGNHSEAPARRRIKKVVEEVIDSESEVSSLTKASITKTATSKRNKKIGNGTEELEDGKEEREEPQENETAEMKKMRQLIEDRKSAKAKKTKSKK